MKAYDLGFGADPASLTINPGSAERLPAVGAIRAGWAGLHGPGISREQWPRSPATGLPMMHALTLRLPEDYRRRGPALPAIAFFAAGDANQDPPSVAPVPDPDSSDPFLRDLAHHVTHPESTILTDLIDGTFSLIWLSSKEFDAGPTAPPPDVRRPREHPYDAELARIWVPTEAPSAAGTVWLVERPDPNAGRTPSEDDESPDDYRLRYDAGFEPRPWADVLSGRSHLGGTSFHIQALPEGLTPWYLELEEFGGLNFGTGNCQIDLESGVFDWAC